MAKSIRRNQRGLAPLFIAVGIAVLITMGLVIWRIAQNSTAKRIQTAVEQVDASKTKFITDQAKFKDCLADYGDTDLCLFAINYSLDKLPYQLDVTSTDKDSAEVITYLSDGKGNTSASGTTNGEATNYIETRDAYYLKDNSDGKWYKKDTGDPTKTTDRINPLSEVKFARTMDKDESKAIAYSKIGQEACGKLTCMKYQLRDPSLPDTKQYFWFDTGNYLLRQYHVEDGSGISDMSLTYQRVTVKAPTDLKDVDNSSTDDTSSDDNGDL